MKPLWHDQATLLPFSSRNFVHAGALNRAYRRMQKRMARMFYRQTSEWLDDLEPRIVPHDEPPPAQPAFELYDAKGKIIWEAPEDPPWKELPSDSGRDAYIAEVSY